MAPAPACAPNSSLPRLNGHNIRDTVPSLGQLPELSQFRTAPPKRATYVVNSAWTLFVLQEPYQAYQWCGACTIKDLLQFSPPYKKTYSLLFIVKLSALSRPCFNSNYTLRLRFLYLTNFTAVSIEYLGTLGWDKYGHGPCLSPPEQRFSNKSHIKEKEKRQGYTPFASYSICVMLKIA